jgi:elongation factor Ts
MPQENLLKKIKELREITGVGFKDCKSVIDETNGDIEKSIILLRKKGIAKAGKRMARVAAEGLIYINEKDNKILIIEINSETDFVAKNKDFINFGKEVSAIALTKLGERDKFLNSEMKNKKTVNDSLIDLVSKIGEKITIRREAFVDNKSINFSYIHSSIENNVGKLGVILSLKTSQKKEELSDLGKQLAMHIAASAPLALDKEDLDKSLIDKEKEIIVDELKNSGKDPKIIDPKKKVKDIIKEFSTNEKIEVESFIRFKVGEGL